jgi:Histidine kinase-, DNA gyrase B-, and HSP90-like ATPase.
MTSARTFHGRPESVPAVRRFVRDVLHDKPSELVQAVELMTCELATNCVQHANSDFELRIDTQGEIRVEVRDANDLQPMPRSPTPQEATGRGLRIVEAMSDAWGIIPAPEGKTVWFTLALEPSPC